MRWKTDCTSPHTLLSKQAAKIKDLKQENQKLADDYAKTKAALAALEKEYAELKERQEEDGKLKTTLSEARTSRQDAEAMNKLQERLDEEMSRGRNNKATIDQQTARITELKKAAKETEKRTTELEAQLEQQKQELQKALLPSLPHTRPNTLEP